MKYRKFDTCFFERYAKFTLATILGKEYEALVNRDRPDLQTEDRKLGIEVTRAIEPDKHNAKQLLKELAGMNINDNEQKKDLQTIVESGYAYGLPGFNYMGYLEHEYWALAHPLKRIISSKVEKVARGFYGKFDQFGLFVFCRDLLDMTQVENSVEYTLMLQNNLDIRYNTLYLSQADTLYVCRLTDNILYEGVSSRIETYNVPDILRREFFFKSLGY